MSEKSIKELMEIAKNPLKTPLRRRTSYSRKESVYSVEQIRKFIEDCNLNSDIKLPILTTLIYAKYLDWCKNNYEVSTSYLSFFKKFRLFFNMKKISTDTYYLVNPEVFDLTEENKVFVANEIKKKTKSKIKKSR